MEFKTDMNMKRKSGVKLTYFPGCTMFEKSRDFERSALKVFEILKFEIEEMKDWYCCGAVATLVDDNLMTMVAPFRNIVLAQKMDAGIVTTFCSACYNVLKNTYSTVKTDQDKRKVLEDFVEEEFTGKIKILHFLEILRDIDDFTPYLKKDLKYLKIAPYYGCLLLRPFKTVGIDDREDPKIMEHILQKIGADVVNFPQRIECCGAHLSVNWKDITADCVKTVIESAKKNGADIIVNSCPLCQYNLDKLQLLLMEKDRDFVPVPILYFTEVLALAFGEDSRSAISGKHYIDPFSLIEKKVTRLAMPEKQAGKFPKGSPNNQQDRSITGFREKRGENS